MRPCGPRPRCSSRPGAHARRLTGRSGAGRERDRPVRAAHPVRTHRRREKRMSRAREFPYTDAAARAAVPRKTGIFPRIGCGKTPLRDSPAPAATSGRIPRRPPSRPRPPTPGEEQSGPEPVTRRLCHGNTGRRRTRGSCLRPVLGGGTTFPRGFHAHGRFVAQRGRDAGHGRLAGRRAGADGETSHTGTNRSRPVRCRSAGEGDRERADPHIPAVLAPRGAPPPTSDDMRIACVVTEPSRQPGPQLVHPCRPPRSRPVRPRPGPSGRGRTTGVSRRPHRATAARMRCASHVAEMRVPFRRHTGPHCPRVE